MPDYERRFRASEQPFLCGRNRSPDHEHDNATWKENLDTLVEEIKFCHPFYSRFTRSYCQLEARMACTFSGCCSMA